MNATMHATATSDVFLIAKHKPEVGELRMRSWRWIVPPTHDTDRVWAKRCKDYWDRQERIYGMRLSDFTMLIDWEGGFVSTYAVVLTVMPGERTANKQRVTFLKQSGGLVQ